MGGKSPQNLIQPPSGGCVLKLNEHAYSPRITRPAAFRRLCVETGNKKISMGDKDPAAFRRLCVETTIIGWLGRLGIQPPSGGCVLKLFRATALPAR